MDEAGITWTTNKHRNRYYKSTFENITEDRRAKIMDVAISEFAARGYNATNINVIAKKAGISIGSMYSYFESKEALFLTIVDEGFHLLETAINEVSAESEDIFDIFEKLLIYSRNYAINYPEMNQIYLDLTTQGLSSLSAKLSKQMESITAKFYYESLKAAKQKGIVRYDLDERLASFYLDNLIIMFQFSFTSDYYKERMKIFLGTDVIEDEDKIIKGLMDFVKKAVSP